MAFEREIETYHNHLSDFLANEGKYVLIKGEEISGPYDKYEETLEAGYDRYGPARFVVRKILKSGQMPRSRIAPLYQA